MNVNLRLVSGTLLTACVLSCCTKLESANDTFGGGGILLGTGGTSTGSGGTNQTPTGGASGRAAGGFAGDLENPGGSGGAHPAAAGTGGRAQLGAGGESGESGASGEAGAAGSNDSECIDKNGFQGAGCYTCAPTDIVSLERACTSATCTGFDNSRRLTLLPDSGKLPDLPAPIPAQAGMGGIGGGGGGGMGGGAGGASAGDTGTGGAGGGSAGAGGAGFACETLNDTGTVIYVTGSSAAKPFLQQIAQQLAGDGVYIVYTSTGSCVGVDAIVNDTPMTTGANAPAATATYWENSLSNGSACDLPSDGVPADLGVSDVFVQTCPNFELTNLSAKSITDAHGPIQTMTFAVPANSPYSEISAQAAYFVFGFGAEGGVLDPTGSKLIWNDEGSIFQRSPTSGTQAMIASAIGVAPGRWRGKAHKTSDDVALDLTTAGQDKTAGAAAIGILAADYIDTKGLRPQIKVLAYQDTHAPCAVFPDSTSNAHDKRNVRDGHYPIWGPLHLLYKIDALKDANRQQVLDIVAYLSGTKALSSGIRLLDVYAQSGLVPECAMHVTRSSDGGDVTPISGPATCSCLFDWEVSGNAGCTPCMVQGDCASGETCSQGYCEK
jgi:hypothetical protein